MESFETSRKRLQGDETELLWEKTMKILYPEANIIKSNTETDRYNHIDYFIDSSGIDIKSYQAAGKLNLNFHDYLILEILDIRGQLGSLYGSAEFIDFYRYGAFVHARRELLVKYHQTHTKDEWVDDLNNGVNKIYRRSPALDIITVVPFIDILSFSTIIEIPYDRI